MQQKRSREDVIEDVINKKRRNFLRRFVWFNPLIINNVCSVLLSYRLTCKQVADRSEFLNP